MNIHKDRERDEDINKQRMRDKDTYRKMFK